MKFNDATNKNGICQDVWYLTGTDSTSFPVSDIARILNKVLRELAMFAWLNSTKWNFDDKNYSTHNIATISLINRQSDYELASSDFDIQKVEVIDVNGNVIKLKFSPNYQDKNLNEQSGVPLYYYLRGNSIWIKPAPDTSKVSTLRIYLSRDIIEFKETDSDKEPGLPTVLHPIIPLMIALEYAGINHLPQSDYLLRKVEEWRVIFVNYYQNRGENFEKINPKIYNFE